MTSFSYRCPATGQQVHGYVADDLGSETYRPVTCTACEGIHLVNPKTGKLLETIAEANGSIPLLKQATPLAASLAITLAATAVLFYFRDVRHLHHLVFFYLFPTALVAMIYGSVLSMVCAIFATLAAAFFLYDPIYSLYVSDPRDIGELVIFTAIGLIGAKCVAKLTPVA